MTLGTKVKQLRVNKKWTQGQLAVYSGLTRSYISLIEIDAIKKPSSVAIINLAKALEVDEDVLNQAAGFKHGLEPEQKDSIDEFTSWLASRRPSAKNLKKLRKLAEALFDENEDD